MTNVWPHTRYSARLAPTMDCDEKSACQPWTGQIARDHNHCQPNLLVVIKRLYTYWRENYRPIVVESKIVSDTKNNHL